MNDESFFRSRDENVHKRPGDLEGDPEPASETLPDGQFQDDDMPTTDGEAADPDDPSTVDDRP